MAQGDSFHIKSHLNGYVLAITGSDKCAGALVAPWEKKDKTLNAQTWYIHSETLTIRSRLNDMCIDVKDGIAQMSPYGPEVSKWQISNAAIRCQGTKQVLEIISADPNLGALVGTGNYDGGANQHWNIEYGKPTYFQIKTKMDNRVLSISDESSHPKAPVVVYSQRIYMAHSQLWYTDRQGLLRSALNNFALDIVGGRICMMPFNAREVNQHWQLENDVIINHSRSDLVLDIRGASRDNGALVLPFQFHGQNNQRWAKVFVKK